MIDEKKLIEEINECDFTADVNKLNANDNGPQLKGFYIGYTEALVRLQPQVDKCSDCSRRKFYQQGYQDGLNADKWIPVEEDMPKEMEEVLVSRKNSKTGTSIGYYNNVFGWYDQCLLRTITDVVAWMPKPIEYKKEGAENGY